MASVPAKRTESSEDTAPLAASTKSRFARTTAGESLAVSTAQELCLPRSAVAIYAESLPEAVANGGCTGLEKVSTPVTGESCRTGCFAVRPEAETRIIGGARCRPQTGSTAGLPNFVLAARTCAHVRCYVGGRVAGYGSAASTTFSRVPARPSEETFGGAIIPIVVPRGTTFSLPVTMFIRTTKTQSCGLISGVKVAKVALTFTVSAVAPGVSTGLAARGEADLPAFCVRTAIFGTSGGKMPVTQA